MLRGTYVEINAGSDDFEDVKKNFAKNSETTSEMEMSQSVTGQE